LPKHEIYRRLEIPELWTLQRNGKVVLRVLSRGAADRRGARASAEARYIESEKSKLLPKLDVAWLISFLPIEPQNAAIHALREAMSGGVGSGSSKASKARPKKRAR
jgi:hypothetical protein